MLPRNILTAVLAVLTMQLITQNQRFFLFMASHCRLHIVQMQALLERRRNARRRRFRNRPYWMLPRPVESWFDIHFYQRNIPEDLFFRQMRMKRDSFEQLLARIRPYLTRENTPFRNCISSEKVLSIGLYRLAHGGSYENTSIAMNVGVSTVFEAFEDVVKALYDIRNEYIIFPKTIAETEESISTFAPFSDLPNIAGAIDGTHIRIRAPKESKVDYFSRYQQYDVVVQGTVNGKKLFIDVAGAFPGSMHDARVLRNSQIYRQAEQGHVLAAGPIHNIGGHAIQPYIVGDSAYPISPWLQKPYPEGTNDPDEIRFNYALSSARVKVECAFGILKGRWRILQMMEEKNMERLSKIVLACVVLHNFCILNGDEWEEEDHDDENDMANNLNINLRDGEGIREVLKNNL